MEEKKFIYRLKNRPVCQKRFIDIWDAIEYAIDDCTHSNCYLHDYSDSWPQEIALSRQEPLIWDFVIISALFLPNGDIVCNNILYGRAK